MPLEMLIPLVIVGSALPLGFFLVRGAGREAVVTYLGTYRRDANPAGYWFWTIYCWSGLAFIVVMLPLILLGLILS